MASNSFGNLFRITTWGESHGKAIGVTIDGCPSGVEINEQIINDLLTLRAPGRSPLTSQRQEEDKAEILSGVFEGKTTGMPITIIIANNDADPSPYEAIKNLLRPGHAHATYLQKYGVFDYRGGGRASARETACRVAAGAVAKQLIAPLGITITASLKQMGTIVDDVSAMEKLLQELIAEGDSVGGLVECVVKGIPKGLGDPVYEKLDANLAKAMMSIPAAKGFEIGKGFEVVTMKGSECNDPFLTQDITETNHAGGVLGGISTGMPLICRVAFKPTPSIGKPQRTVTVQGETATLTMPKGSRHDPCVAIRALPVVEAMTALALADAWLLNRSAQT